MTAVNVIIGRALHIVTDGAVWDLGGSGAIQGFTAKTVTLPHLNAAIATSGFNWVSRAISNEINVGTFDELRRVMPGVIAKLPQPMRLALAGWSDRGPEAYWSEGGRFERVEGNLVMNPGMSPEELQRRGWVLAHDTDERRFDKSIVRLLEIQRAMEGRPCGGFVAMTTITQDEIRQRVLHRWQDRIGERIAA